MSPARMDRAEAAVRTVIDLAEAFRCHDIAAMTACMNGDCRVEPFTPGQLIQGVPGVEEFCRGLFRDFPDLSLDVEEIFGTGFRCVLRWKCGWKGVGGAVATGTVTAGTEPFLRGAGIFNIKNGLISEALLYRM